MAPSCRSAAARSLAHAGPADVPSASMEEMDPTLRVLVLGLDPRRVPGPWDPEPVASLIEVGRARFAEHGVGAHFCLFGLDGSDDVEAVVTAALRSNTWECVVIGGGVRHDVGLLEDVVNLVHRHAPGAAIAFNESPAEIFDAAARWIETDR